MLMHTRLHLKKKTAKTLLPTLQTLITAAIDTVIQVRFYLNNNSQSVDMNKTSGSRERLDITKFIYVVLIPWTTQVVDPSSYLYRVIHKRATYNTRLSR